MLQIDRVAKDPRLSRAFLGVSQEELVVLEPVFEQALWAKRRSQKRQRAPGEGRQGFLTGVRHKLFFLFWSTSSAIQPLMCKVCYWVLNVPEPVVGCIKGSRLDHYGSKTLHSSPNSALRRAAA